LARLRPASKIGCSSCAAPVKAQLPLLNRPDSSLLAVPKLAGQRDPREERRARRADVGVGGDQLLLGGTDVGATDQELRRQARGDVDRELPFVEGQRRRQVGGQRLADQQLQGVLVERALPRRLRERGAGALEQRLGLPVVELGRRAVVEAQLGEPVRFLAGRERLPGDGELLLVGEQGEVGRSRRRRSG
jgi:hypothetical protein